MENREAVNLEFEFQRHKNKSKLRETELLEALNDKEKEIKKLERSINALSAERLQNTKEELLQKSLNESGKADENGKVCIKCEDLQRLLEQNKKVGFEFEKLTLEYEKLKLNYIEIEKENDTNKLKILQLEELQEKDKAQCEKLLSDVQHLREKLQNVQKDYEQLSSENSSKHEECIALTRRVEVATKEMVVLEEKFTKLELSWQEQQQTIKDIENQYANIQKKYEQLQNQYEQLENTSGQSLTDCHRLEKENVELQTEIEQLKKKVQDAQQKLLESYEKYEESNKENKAANEEFIAETTKIHEENEQLKKQLLEIQTQFDDLQKEYDDLSNQLMDNLQDNESLKSENNKLQDKLLEYEEKNQAVCRAEAELNELKSQLEKVLSNESKNLLKPPSPGCNSSMRSSGVCIENEYEEEFECYPPSQDLLRKFYELSESLTEIELEPTKGKTKLFRSATKNSTPNSYKMYLKNILGVSKTQKEFDMEIENIHLQGCFKHHSFHIVELSSKDESAEIMECDTSNTNGCENMAEYIEKLKQEIIELKSINERERLSNKSLLESTERAFSEMREQITQLSAELMEKSIFVENCACNTYKQQIETLEKEKADITIICEELQEKVNCTLNGSFNMLMNTTVPGAEVKSLADDKLSELQRLKLREQELLESFDSQTKTLEELTQRYLDMESELEAARELLKKQEKNFKEQNNQLQLEILQKLELSASEYRDNMKKYNREWEVRREEYEQTIKELQQQIEELKTTNLEVLTKEIKQENNCDTRKLEETKQNFEKERENLEETPENMTGNLQEEIDEEMPQDIEAIKQDNSRLEEENQTLQQQLNTAEEQLELIKLENQAQYEEITLLDSKISSLEEHLRDIQILHAILAKENSSLETQVKDLEEDLDCIPQLHDKNQQLSDEMEKLNQEYIQLQEKLQKAETQTEEFLKENSKREVLIQTLQGQLKQLTVLEEEKKSLESQWKNLKQEYSNTHDKLQKAEEKIRDYHKEDHKQKELIQNLQTKLINLSNLEEEKKTLGRRMESLKQENLIVQTKLQKAEEQIQEFCNEDTNREELIKTLQTKLSHVTAVEEEKKALENVCQHLKENLCSLKEKEIDNLKEMEALKHEITLLNENLSELYKSQTELQMEKSVLEQKLQQLTTERNLLNTDQVLLETQLSELKEELKTLHEQCTQLQKEKAALEEQLKCLKGKEKAEELLEQLVKEKNELLQNLHLTSEKLEVAQKQLQDKEKEMTYNKQEKAQIQQDLQSLKESLLKTIEEKHQKLEETEREKEKTKQDNVNLYQDLQALKESFNQAKEVKHEQQLEMESCKEENSHLKEDLATLRDQLSKLKLEKQEQEINLEKAKLVHNNLQQDLETLRDSLSKAMEEKQQEVKKLKINYQTIEQQNLKLEKQLQDLQIALNNASEDKQQQLNENTQLQNELGSTKESLTKLQEEQQQLQEKLLNYQKLEEDKNKLETALSAFKSAQSGTLNSLQEKRDQLFQTLQKYQQQNKQYQENEETLKQKIESLSQKLHETRCQAQTYEKLLDEHEEVEKALTTATATNQKLQQEIAQLTCQQENYATTIENLTGEIEKLNLQLDQHLNEKEMLHTKLSHLKETLQGEQSSLQRQHHELKSSMEELQLKCDSLQTTNTQLENLNKQLEQQLNEAKEKLKEFNVVQKELNELKDQHTELQHKMKATVEEAGHCSLALREDVKHHKQLLQKQLENYNALKVEMETKQKSLSDENLELSTNIETLQKEKQSLEEKLRELTVRNFEQDLQRQVIDATANTSMDSNNSYSPKGRRSLERMGAVCDLKAANISIEDKLSAIQQKNTTERKNRRLSTHDERRRQSYWGAAHDKETMTEPVDTSCNCIELDRKLKECERNLFIKNSQVTALSMELKNHPLKDENASLMKRLQEEQDKHRIEIKRYKNKLYEQTVKAEKAIATAAHATAKSQHVAANAALAAEQQVISPVLPKIVTDVEVQTDDDLSACLQKLQGKYNDLKNICRYRYNVIKELEEKVAQKENSDGNSLSALEAAHFKVLNNQCESLKKELKTIKEKYENAKKVLNSRREEIVKLRAQLEEVQ